MASYQDRSAQVQTQTRDTVPAAEETSAEPSYILDMMVAAAILGTYSRC